MWPFKRQTVRDPTIIGQWRLSPTEERVRERFGDHAMTFSGHGELVHSTIEKGHAVGRVLLVYRVESGVIVTNQPSAPREERIPYRIERDSLFIGSPLAAMVRDPSYAADPSARALALATTALDHGLGSAHEGSPFVPFLMAQTAASRQLHRFVSETPDEARNGARRRFGEQQDQIEVAAWVSVGYVTIDGRKYDAVLAELSSVEAREGLLVAQPYSFRGRSAYRVAGMQTQTNQSWFDA